MERARRERPPTGAGAHLSRAPAPGPMQFKEPSTASIVPDHTLPHIHNRARTEGSRRERPRSVGAPPPGRRRCARAGTWWAHGAGLVRRHGTLWGHMVGASVARAHSRRTSTWRGLASVARARAWPGAGSIGRRGGAGVGGEAAFGGGEDGRRGGGAGEGRGAVEPNAALASLHHA